MMSETQERAVCQVCGEAIVEQAVHCRRCSTPHHRDCWDFVGHCSTFACGCVDCKEGLPRRGAGKVDPEAGDEAVIRFDERGQGWQGNTRLALPTTARALTFIEAIDGGQIDVSAPHVRLDLDTPLERLLQWGGLIALFASNAFLPRLLGKVVPYGLPLCFFLATALLGLRLLVECTYVLDNETRELLYVRSIAGSTSVWTVCSFEEVESVGVRYVVDDPNFGHEASYAVLIVLPHGMRVQVSNATKDFLRACGFARQLAKHLGTKYIAAKMTTGLQRPSDNVPMVAKQSNWYTKPFFGRASVTWVLLFIISMVFSLVWVLVALGKYALFGSI